MIILLAVLGIGLVATPIVLENMDPAPVASNIVNKPTVNYSPAPVVKEDIKKALDGFDKELRNKKGDDEPLIQAGIVTESSGSVSAPYLSPEQRTLVALVEKFRLNKTHCNVSVGLVAIKPTHPSDDFYREVCEACDEELKIKLNKLKKSSLAPS